MTGGGARRAALTGPLADYLLTHGVQAATLRPLARAVGTSDRMLIYHFGSKDGVFAAGMEAVLLRLRVLLDTVPGQPMAPDDLLVMVLPLTRQPAVQPFLTLWLEIAALAARGDPFWIAIGRRLAEDMLGWIAARLAPLGGQPDRETARRVLAQVEGEVMLQAVKLP
jgi:AcrR family transcriptional regulator